MTVVLMIKSFSPKARTNDYTLVSLFNTLDYVYRDYQSPHIS